MPTLLSLAFLLVPLEIFASTAATRLGAAEQHAREVHLEAALSSARSALEAGDASPEELWRIHALLGELSASIGHAQPAQREFEVTLELHPDYHPPRGASPRLTEPYELARRHVPVGLEATLQLVPGPHGVDATLEAAGDGQRLIQSAQLRVQGERRSMARQAGLPGRFTASFPCGAGPCTAEVVLVDEWGNTLRLMHGSAAPTWTPSLPAAAPAPRPVELARAPTDRVWYRRPAVWLAASAVVALAAGTLAGVRAENEYSQLKTVNAHRGDYTYPYAQSLDQATHRDRTYMWIGLGAGAACGAGVVILW